MFKTIGNFIFLAASGITCFGALTGKDFKTLPASIAQTKCGHLAKNYANTSFSVNGTARKIFAFSDLTEIGRNDEAVICRAFVHFEGVVGTYVRLSAFKTAGKTQSEIGQARPEDYTCELLGQEFALRLTGQPFGDYGNLLRINASQPVPSAAPLHCAGMAEFSGGATLPMRYSFDGQNFAFD